MKKQWDHTLQIEEFFRSIDASRRAYNHSFTEGTGFGGPSLYFHLKALEAAESSASCFSLMAYSMLASWGMHRMGRGGPKMVEYELFAESISDCWPAVGTLKSKKPADLTAEDWGSLESIFTRIRAMVGGSILVGNSKVLAHCLPKLIAPIDRYYTLHALRPASVPREAHKQFARLRALMVTFFHPIAADPRFAAKTSAWRRQGLMTEWDTSDLKTIDNLIIGRRKPKPVAELD